MQILLVCALTAFRVDQRLLLACFWRVMRLEILDDFLRGVFGDGCAVGFYHFVYFGSPHVGGQRRLHDDESRSVASVAV